MLGSSSISKRRRPAENGASRGAGTNLIVGRSSTTAKEPKDPRSGSQGPARSHFSDPSGRFADGPSGAPRPSPPELPWVHQKRQMSFLLTVERCLSNVL